MKNWPHLRQLLFFPLYLPVLFLGLILIPITIPLGIFAFFRYGIPEMKWTHRCGKGKKLIALSDKGFTLKVGQKCQKTFPFDCIKEVRHFRFFKKDRLSLKIKYRCHKAYFNDSNAYFLKQYYHCRNLSLFVNQLHHHNIDTNGIDKHCPDTAQGSIFLYPFFDDEMEETEIETDQTKLNVPAHLAGHKS